MPEVTAPVTTTPSAQNAEKPADSSPKVAPGSSSKGQETALPSAASVTGGKVGEEKQAETTKETKEEARKEAERRYKLKVNGQERDYSESEVLRKAQLADSADEKFKKASEMQKQAEQFIEALRKNPLAVLTHPELGLNFKEIAENYLGDTVRREMMDPVQRELEELRDFKRKQEEERQRAEEDGKNKEMSEKKKALHQKTVEYYDRKISEVLQATNLPKTPNTIKRVAEVLRNAVTNGYELDVETAVDLVNEDYRTDIGSLFSGLDGDALISALGEPLVKKIRTHDIARLKAKLAGTAQPATIADKTKAQPTPARREQNQKFMSESEWKAARRRQFLGE